MGNRQSTTNSKKNKRKKKKENTQSDTSSKDKSANVRLKLDGKFTSSTMTPDSTLKKVREMLQDQQDLKDGSFWFLDSNNDRVVDENQKINEILTSQSGLYTLSVKRKGAKADELVPLPKPNKPDAPESLISSISEHKFNEYEAISADKIDKKNCLVKTMTNAEKKFLYLGAPAMLNGRYINNDNEIQICSPGRLFKFIDNNDIDWGEKVLQADRAGDKINESYSALQSSLTENKYWSLETQASVAGFGGISVGSDGMIYKQHIEKETNLYMTHNSYIIKADIAIDEKVVQYTNEFMDELNELLDNQEKSEEKWNDFTNKFGQYYIERCVIGGVAYATRHEVVNDDQERESTKLEFKVAAKGTFEGVTAGASASGGSFNETQVRKLMQNMTITLQCRGGNVALAVDPKQFAIWKASVNADPNTWDIVDITRIKPFYYLLPQQKQDTITELMPKKMVKNIEKKPKSPKRCLIELRCEYFDAEAKIPDHVQEIDGRDNNVNYYNSIGLPELGFDMFFAPLAVKEKIKAAAYFASTKHVYLKAIWGGPEEAVSNIKVLISKYPDNEENTTKDMAYGSGGGDAYYRQLKMEKNGKEAITEIYLWTTPKKDSQPSSRGFRDFTKDINFMRGGNYLYLCWKKEDIEYY